MKALDVACPECGADVDEDCMGTFLWDGRPMLHLARVAALAEVAGGATQVGLVVVEER